MTERRLGSRVVGLLWITPEAKEEGRMKNEECQPKAISEPGASQLQARSLGYALLCSSRVALVLLLFSSCSARLIPAGSREHPSGFTERRSVFDCLGLAGIQSL
jgi:hypothetical protein